MKCLDGWDSIPMIITILERFQSGVAAPNDGDNRNPAGDCQGANGQTDIPGSAVMNCTGFVWHVMYKKASGIIMIPRMQQSRRLAVWGPEHGAVIFRIIRLNIGHITEITIRRRSSISL